MLIQVYEHTQLFDLQLFSLAGTCVVILNLIIAASMLWNYFVKISFGLSSNCIHLLYPFDWSEIRMQAVQIN